MPHRGYVTVSKDIFDCHDCRSLDGTVVIYWVETMDAKKNLIHKQPPPIP